MEDIELRQIFGRLFEKIESVETGLNDKINSLDAKFSSLDAKVTKNSIQIESIQTDIKTIVEIQKTHFEQNERDHKNILEHIDNKTNFLESILKIHSEEIATLKRKIG